jgi:hypothetical protein
LPSKNKRSYFGGASVAKKKKVNKIEFREKMNLQQKFDLRMKKPVEPTIEEEQVSILSKCFSSLPTLRQNNIQCLSMARFFSQVQNLQLRLRVYPYCVALNSVPLR